MSIRKKLASYLLAGVLAFSTIASNLMTIPAYADNAGDNTSGNTYYKDDSGLMAYPMIAVYLSGSDKLSDGAACSADEAQDIISNGEAINDGYRRDAMYVFPKGMWDNGEVYLAKNFSSATSAPNYYGRLDVSNDLGKKCINLTGSMPSDLSSNSWTFLKDILGGVDIDDAGQYVGSYVADEISTKYEAYRAKKNYSAKAEWAAIEPLIKKYMSSSTYDEAKHRYDSGKPVTLIFELYLPNKGAILKKVYYMSAYSYWNVGTTTWKTSEIKGSASLDGYGFGTYYAFKSNSSSNYYGATYYPAYNSSATLDGTKTTLPPSTTGIIGGWCYYSFCNNGSNGSLKITSTKDVVIDDKTGKLDNATKNAIINATGITVGYTDGISEKTLKKLGITASLDGFASYVAQNCKSIGALTGVLNNGMASVDDSAATTQIKSGANTKKSSTFSISPAEPGKTYYVAYEKNLYCAYEDGDLNISKGPLGAIAFCVNTTKKSDGTYSTSVTFKKLSNAGSTLFTNASVSGTYNSSTNTITINYDDTLTITGGDEASVSNPQPAISTIVDIDEYYVTGYPSEYNYSSTNKGANTQLVYTDTTLANTDDAGTAYTFSWHWSDSKASINKDIDTIIATIADGNSKLGNTIGSSTGAINTQLKFAPDNKYDYNIGLVNKDAGWSFTVNSDWVKKYDSTASNFNITTADAAVTAANGGSRNPINKGTAITSLLIGDETVTDLPSGKVSLSHTSGTDLTKDQIKTYLTEYSDYAKKYALYEAMVAQGSGELAKVIKYWTKAASALYAGAMSELSQANYEAQSCSAQKVVTNNNLNKTGVVKIGRTYTTTSFVGIVYGTGNTSNAAYNAATENLNAYFGDTTATGTKATAEQHKAKIEKYSDALYKITGWKLKCTIPYKEITKPSSVTGLPYTLYRQNYSGRYVISEYLYLYYIPEYNKTNSLTVSYHDRRGYHSKPAAYKASWSYDYYDTYNDAKSWLNSKYGDPAEYNALSASCVTDTLDPPYMGYCYYSSYTGNPPASFTNSTGLVSRTLLVNKGNGNSGSVAIFSANSSTDIDISKLPGALKTLIKGTNAGATKVGGYLADAIKLTEDATKAIGELEAKRPHAEIHIYQDLSAKYNNTFQAANVASYMLSMKWANQTPFVKNRTYLAQVLDRNPGCINVPNHTPTQNTANSINNKVSDGSTYLLTMMNDTGKAAINTRVINYLVGGKTCYVPVLTAKYQYGLGSYAEPSATNLPTKTPAVTLSENKFKVNKSNSYLIAKSGVQSTNLDSLGYVYEKFGIYTTYWLIDGENTLHRYAPTADWANALPSSVKSLVNGSVTYLGNYSTVPRANLATVASATKANGIDYAQVSSANVRDYKTDGSTNANSTVLYTRYFSGTAVNEDNYRYFLTSVGTGGKWYQDKGIAGKLLGTNNIWTTSKTTYKLEASFLNRYITADKTGNTTTPTKFTLVNDNWTPVSTEGDASKGYGSYTRESTTEHYGVYPLVKMGYYASPSASDISYTFIVGQKKRNLLSNVHYELGVTSNAAPVVFANALASSANANSLATSYTGNGGSAPVAYSGTGITVSYEGDLAFTFQSFALVDKDADKGYQSEWGNLTSTTSAHTEWLESLGAEESTIQTSTGGTTQAYTLGYIAGSSISMRNKSVYNKDVWTLSANSISYMYEDTEKTVQQDINLTIVGTELQGVAVTKDFYDIDGVKNSKGTYTGKTTEATLTAIKKAAPAVYRALKDMDIGTILEETFDGNAGGAVTADANGNTASGLKATGNNWYNEYVYCLALRMQSTTMMMTPPVFTDKVPIELGPQTPTDKSKYFSNGYGLVVEKLLIKFAGENAGDLGGLTGGEQISATIWSKSKGNTDNDLIIADVPVTAAN